MSVAATSPSPLRTPAPPQAMRVLLVTPTALDMQGRPIRQRRLHLPALTFPLLAALSPPWVHVRLVSETVQDIPWDEPWDLVGVTGMGSGIVRGWQIGDEFRRRGVKVVMGGIGGSLADPAWSLAHVDALVVGEAEDVWPRLLDDAAAGRLQPIYRADHSPDLGRLPVPRYDLMDRGTLGLWRPVQATRGCVKRCRFCSVRAFFGGRFRKAPIASVVRDVRAAKASGGRHIAFVDDNITADPAHAARLFEALIPENITWISQCSLDVARRPDLLRLAAASGCRLLSVGIESVNPESLAMLDKPHNLPAQYAQDINTIRAHGIEISTEMMIGMDGDDATVFARTFDFIMDNRISVPRVHIMTPVPGTEMWQRLEREGRILSRDYGRFSGGRVVFRPRHIDPVDLQRGYWDLYDRLFTLRSIAHRWGPNPARLGPVMRAFVCGVNFHYRNHVRHRICPGIV